MKNDYDTVVYRVDTYAGDRTQFKDKSVFFTDSLDYFDKSMTGYKKEDAKKYYINLHDFKVFDPVNELNLDADTWSTIWGSVEDFDEYDINYEFSDDSSDDEIFAFTSTDDLAEAGRKLGYDITIIRDIPNDYGRGEKFTEYVVHNSNAVKSESAKEFNKNSYNIYEDDSLNSNLLESKIINKLKSMSYSVRYVHEGWKDENGESVDWEDDREEPEDDWYYVETSYYLCKNDSNQTSFSWRIDESSKIFTIVGIYGNYAKSTRGFATRTLEEVLEMIPKDYTIEIENSINDDYWNHMMKKYSQYNWENVRESLAADKSLNEEVYEADFVTVFVSKSPYEIRNKLFSSHTIQRVYIDARNKPTLYLLADGFNTIHTEMIEIVNEEGGYELKLDDYDDKNICIIYVPNDEPDEFDEYGDAVIDEYDTVYEYKDFKIYTRFQDFTTFELYKILGTPENIRHLNIDDYEDRRREESLRCKFSRADLLKSKLLLEKSRTDLIVRGKNSDAYKTDRSKGKNRYQRRTKSRVATSVSQFNKINMDEFFKKDILTVGIEVYGETNNYVVTIRFSGVLAEIRRELELSHKSLEFKTIQICLSRVFNRGDVYVFCSCPDWKYRQSYHATKDKFTAGEPENRAPQYSWTILLKETGGCKHVLLVLSNMSWMLKIASVINNYIKYAKQKFVRNYNDIIAPALYGVQQLSFFKNTSSGLGTTQQTIDRSNKRGATSGRFKKGEVSNRRSNNITQKGPTLFDLADTEEEVDDTAEINKNEEEETV